MVAAPYAERIIMDNIIIKGNFKFHDPNLENYERNFTAKLCDAAAFEYGNNTAVFIKFDKMPCGLTPEPIYLDTRYTHIEKTKDGFKNFIKRYFKDNYLPHDLRLED